MAASACRSGDKTLVVGRTAVAEFSICRNASGSAYYRGLTPANGQSVEVDNAVPEAGGWLVTAQDGTSYAITAASMVITLTSGRQVTSRMLAYQGGGGRQVAASTVAPVGRDANGFALGGPPQPTAPANYDNPSHADCLRYLSEVRAWSNYQNQHRPAGSTNGLPFSGQVQYLWVVVKSWGVVYEGVNPSGVV